MRHNSRPETHTHKASASAPAASNGDLIDFGEEPEPELTQKVPPIESKIADKAASALTQDPPGFERPQLLKDMTNREGQPKKSAPIGAGADLVELQDGLGNLQVASEGSKNLTSATGETKRPTTKRMDSETQEEDEFVDAES